MSNNIRAIAIHLPQFYPFPENDVWWGKGFTEWTNVTKAKPLFKGHYQPHLPADLGFYDLRLEEARVAQAELAKAYGIYGFCFYHYWFTGKRLLNRPLDDMIQTKTPDFPFMLCWANENWSRRWDGQDQDILIKQDYSEADDKNHINFLIKHYFTDKRYIQVNSKPIFLIYRPNLFPDIRKTIKTWRSEAVKHQTELYIGYVKSYAFDPVNFEDYGFECAIEFHPDLYVGVKQQFPPIADKIKHRLGIKKSVYYENYISTYTTYVNKQLEKKVPNKPNVYPGITPGWDNSARKNKNAIIFKNSTPEEYGRWLNHIKELYKDQDTFLFINAWNEWAEGNHLEPCQKWGKKYLEETKRFVELTNQ